MADSLSLAMLVLLESLSPEQRAVLLLHDVFDYELPTSRRDHRQEPGQRPSACDASATPRRAAPTPLPNDAGTACVGTGDMAAHFGEIYDAQVSKDTLR
jgi:hypothetical protein